MKTFYKFILSLFISMFFLFSFAYGDYKQYQEQSAKFLSSRSIIVKYSNLKDYRLSDKILRQEVIGSIYSYGFKNKRNCKNYFKDTSAYTPNNWICNAVETLVDNGLINKSTYFRPEDYITKSEIVGIVVKYKYGSEYKYNKFSSISWQKQVVDFAVSKGLIDNFYDYDSEASRGFFFYIFAKSLGMIPEENNDLSRDTLCEIMGVCETDSQNFLTNENKNDFKTSWRFPGEGVYDGDNINPGMGITGNKVGNINSGLFLSSSGYNSSNIESIPTTGIVNFGKIYFNATGKDVILYSLEIKREGIGQNSDIKRIYLEKNGVRVSNRANIGINGAGLLSFNGGLKIMEGSTLGLDLIVELNNSTGIGNEHRFSISSVDSVEANTNISGDFPIKTPLKRISSYSTEELELNNKSFNLSFNRTQNNVIFGEFSIYASGRNDYQLQRVIFRNLGSSRIEDTLTNFKLIRDGKILSYNYQIEGRNVIIDFYDLISSGRTYYYQLRADVYNIDRNSDTYQFEIKNSSDLSLTEESTGFSPSIKIK